MKRIIFVLAAFIFQHTLFAQQPTFTLASKDLGGQFNKEYIFNGFGCTGTNKSPQLSWSNAPADAKSFAVTIYDPAAPTGSGWWHWVIFDIPANIAELKQGAGSTDTTLAPLGSIQGITDFGTAGYGGPCPPVGDAPHPYIITVYALKTAKLGLDKKASPALVGYMLSANVIAKASIIAYYKR